MHPRRMRGVRTICCLHPRCKACCCGLKAITLLTEERNDRDCVGQDVDARILQQQRNRSQQDHFQIHNLCRLSLANCGERRCARGRLGRL